MMRSAPKLAHPTADRREVGGGIAEATVPLANDHGCGEPVDEDAQRAVVDHGVPSASSAATSCGRSSL